MTYWSRCLAVGLLAALVWCWITFQPPRNSAALAREIFEILAWIAFLGSVLSGVFLTADALSSERREGTLGLLFLTELRGLDVVLGKLISTSIIAAYILIGILPVLAIPLLMGGVTGQEFLATSIALGATMLCSLGIGICASSRSRDMAQAMGLALLLLAGLCTLPWFVSWTVSSVYVPPNLCNWMETFSPMTAVNSSIQWSRTTPRRQFIGQSSTLLTGAIGCLGIGLAATRLTRRWRTEISQPAASKSHPPFWTSNLVPKPNSQLDAETSCTRWYLAQLRPTRSLQMLGFLVALFFWGDLVLCVLGWNSTLSSNQKYFVIALFTAYALHFLFKLQVALAATGTLAHEAAEGGLEQLLTTPLTPARILGGHRVAVWRSLRIAQFHVAAVNGAMLINLFNPSLRIIGDAFLPFFAILTGGLLLIWVDTFAITQIGAWFALSTRSPGRALVRTLAISYLPTMIGILCFVLIMAHSGGPDTAAVLMVSIELFLLIMAILFGGNSGSRTLRSFRRLAGGSPALSSRILLPDRRVPFSTPATERRN